MSSLTVCPSVALSKLPLLIVHFDVQTKCTFSWENTFCDGNMPKFYIARVVVVVPIRVVVVVNNTSHVF